MVDYVTQGSTPNQQNYLITDADQKVKYWKRVSIACGLIPLFGMTFIMSFGDLHQEPWRSWWMVLGPLSVAIMFFMFVCPFLSVLAFINIFAFSHRRKHHRPKDYLVAIAGLVPNLVFCIASFLS